jgi:SlyX protein
MTDEAIMSRIEKLEERSAFQEHAIEELSETITDQWKLIDSLKRDIKRLTDELKEVEDNMAQGERREPPPPHY